VLIGQEHRAKGTTRKCAWCIFDPVARVVQDAVQSPIKLRLKPAQGGGQSTIVGSGGKPTATDEKLGQDIGLSQGDPGPAAPTVPFCATPALLGVDARRSLACLVELLEATDGQVARRCRLCTPQPCGEKRAPTSRFRDELRPDSTCPPGLPGRSSEHSDWRDHRFLVEEQLVPRGVNGELAAQTKACFEACDNGPFCGWCGWCRRARDASNGGTIDR